MENFEKQICSEDKMGNVAKLNLDDVGFIKGWNIENVYEMLKYWCYEDKMGRFGNVGSVALQDLAKVPPGQLGFIEYWNTNWYWKMRNVEILTLWKQDGNCRVTRFRWRWIYRILKH